MGDAKSLREVSNMGHEIRVTIAGSTQAGKITIAELIVRTLRKVGIRCDTPEPSVLHLQDHVSALTAADTHVTVQATGSVMASPATAGAASEIVTPLVALRAQHAALELLLAERVSAEPRFAPEHHPASRAIRKLESGR
jgi:hypothetical protein